MAGAQEPLLSHGFLGQQSKFQPFGLKVLSHADAKIKMKEWDGNELKVQILYNEPVKTIYSLSDASTKEERSDCVFSETDTKNQIITYHITVPTPGFWKFQIFALPKSDTSKNLVGVYNYLIHCVKATKIAYPYPTQFTEWKDGCILCEPKILHRDVSQQKVSFRVVIPNAEKVAVVVGQEWTHLIPLSGSKFTGEVNLENHYGRNASVTLNATYTKDGGSYGVLLEYII